jgi:hypothetical protein
MPLSPVEVETIRGRIMSAASVELLARNTPAPFKGLFAIAIASVMAAGLFLTWSRDWSKPSATQHAASVHLAPVERRQIQFETPGGTKVTWVLTNQDIGF